MPDEPTPDVPAGDPPAEPDPVTPAATPAEDVRPDQSDLGDAGKKALERERDARKLAEKATKDNAKKVTDLQNELEKFRKAALSEQDRAVVEAREQGAAEAMQTVGQRLAAAELRAALTGVVPDPQSIVEDLNLSRYVGDDGEVDADAVAALRAKYEAFTPVRKVPGVPAGPRGDVKEPSIDEKYRAALAAGKPKDALSLQNQKLQQLAQQ